MYDSTYAEDKNSSDSLYNLDYLPKYLLDEAKESWQPAIEKFGVEAVLSFIKRNLFIVLGFVAENHVFEIVEVGFLKDDIMDMRVKCEYYT